ncbi:hypothetical protein N7495_007183 [Penicillium taxi]|uniref:uncharacterized protein n=1 Tax=Penicillium taxi TaxID=168475 RepID=UPI0025451AB1|nr:uncharacterized protein N7495_007183 [Penicillium taxi]KAJ5895492.1 hypothetical protein N7495_007183 [Penicillium taxi]
MTSYSVQDESARVLDTLFSDPKIDFPESFKKAAKKVKFVGHRDPFIPTPLKITESSSALSAYTAAVASAISADRYGLELQDIEVNTDVATLFLMSLVLATINGKPALENPKIRAEIAKGDVHEMRKPIHRQCTNVYQTKDGKWYHLHSSMNAAPSMKMMGVPEQDVTHDEAIEIYKEKVAQWDSAEIERVANDEYRQAGVVCNTPEEFFASEHGKIMGEEPLYTLKKRNAPRKPWPETKDTARPLAGIRVIDFSRVIAAPVISKVLAALGAEVLKVTWETLPDISITWLDLSTGKRDTNLNLKTPEGKAKFAELVKGADVLIDGYRPGVLSKLGFDADSLRADNPSLIYLRENCYGFKGPLAYRSGWQQVSDCVVGIAWEQGKFFGLDEPIVPLLPNSDYQMGIAGAAAVAHALYARTKDDVTFDIDISLTQYNIWYYRLGHHAEEQKKHLLKLHENHGLRHYHEIFILIEKMHAAVRKVRPDAFEQEEYFETMSGKDWGIEDDVRVLSLPFTLNKSRLTYDVPSGIKGRDKPEWL